MPHKRREMNSAEGDARPSAIPGGLQRVVTLETSAMILRSGSYAASRGTTPPPYQRLSVDEKNQASELVAEKAIAALPDSFEEWQFDRAQWAHYLSFGAFVPIEIIFAVFIDTTEDLAVSRREDTTYAILASLLLAARILASQGSSDLKPVWRRVVVILYVGMLFTAQLSSIVALKKMHPDSHAMPTSDFVSEAYLYTHLRQPRRPSCRRQPRHRPSDGHALHTAADARSHVPHARALADGLARRGARGAVGYDGLLLDRLVDHRLYRIL